MHVYLCVWSGERQLKDNFPTPHSTGVIARKLNDIHAIGGVSSFGSAPYFPMQCIDVTEFKRKLNISLGRAALRSII